LSKKFYLTTAIDYVNSKPHLGTAYEKVAADCIARSRRLLGEDVLFVMGNDEHSVNVEKSARAAGLAPKEYTDRMEAEFRIAWKKLDISFDDFIRTTEPRHTASVHELLRRVAANGYITRAKYSGWYCEGCEAFYTEKDLIDGKCPNHKTVPRWVEEENYFFKLSQFRDRLLEHIRSHPDFIRPQTRKNEIVAFLESGLEDLSISRAGLSWGIPFPDDPKHVVYVWFDALTNYISAAGFGTDEARFRKWWPADCHIVGKDITRFHCVIWPAMLMAADIELPRSVFGHGFIYHSGVKMSKSLGNIVNPLDVVNVTGADPLRYFLLREITFGKDGEFSWDSFLGRYHADLANDLGNLVKRTVDMTVKFCGGVLEEDSPAPATELRALVAERVSTIPRAYESFQLSEALVQTWELVRRANGVIESTKPWELAKTPSGRPKLLAVLSELLETIRIVAHLLEPVIPKSSREILAHVGVAAKPGETWATTTVWRDKRAWRVESHPPLFPRIEMPKEDVSPAAAKASPANDDHAPAGPSSANDPTIASFIDFETFREIRLVVATVVSAEKISGASRLLKLDLDLGSEKRQVVSGIAEHFRPEDLPGKQVVLVANLKPAKIRGIDSQGMILVAQSGGRMTLLGPTTEIDAGAEIS
jgi:methionyl-tRNA synthetase